MPADRVLFASVTIVVFVPTVEQPTHSRGGAIVSKMILGHPGRIGFLMLEQI